MDHGGEAARPTMTVESTDLGMAGSVQGGEAQVNTGTFHGQLGAAAARHASVDGFQPSAAAAAYHSSTVFALQARSVPVAVFHREPGPGVAYANIDVFWRLPGPVGVVLVVGLQLPDGVTPMHDNYYGGYYFVLQPRLGARRGAVLADLLSGVERTVYSGDYALQRRLGAGHGEVLGNMFAVPDGAGHGEVFVGLLPGNYSYYPWQPRPGAGRGEVFIGPLTDGVGMVFDDLGNFEQQTRPDNLGAGHDGSGALDLDDDLGAVYDNRGMAAQHLRHLFAFVGIGASSVAVNGLAAGPGSPAVVFYHFALLLGGLFIVILHVLRV